MCWCFPFGLSNQKKRTSTSSGERKRREKPPAESLHGNGVPVVAEVQEKRRSRETPQKRRSKETVTPRSPRRERESHRPRQDYQHQDVYRSREQYRPALNVQVPNLWQRDVQPQSSNSSQEMLLNPRPHRSPHTRQRHPKRTSQTTLRGRGAKRDPPKHSKSKKNIRQESSRQGWSFFSPPPPKTPSRSSRHYQTLDSSPRSHRSPRTHNSSYQYQEVPEASSSSSQRHHRSRQHQRQPAPSSRQARSRTPNTAARRTPDRRFAVRAATDRALEDLRREVFAQPSPPPRRERVQRYQGVAIPTSTIPFNWDCVSSSQTSAGYDHGSSSRHRRSRR